MRRRPLRVELQRVLQRAQRLRLVVFLEEQQAPGRVDGRVRRNRVGRLEERIGIAGTAERLRGTGAAEEPFDVPAGGALLQHLGQVPRGLLSASELQLDQPELQRRFAAWLARHGRLEDGDRLVVPASGRGELAKNARGSAVGCRPLFRQRLGLRRTATRDGAAGHGREALRVGGRLLIRVRRRKRRPRAHI